jgi:LysR family glycine cleavage system transcriptional activator
MEAFLEVARYGTVKAAAIELGLSMPALSRRIQTLEHSVGRPLFNRHHHGLSLTEAGRALHEQLSPILDELRTVIGQVGSPDASLRLHLNVLPLFAQQRLFPRLPELRREHPELHIDIDTMSHAEARLATASTRRSRSRAQSIRCFMRRGSIRTRCSRSRRGR